MNKAISSAAVATNHGIIKGDSRYLSLDVLRGLTIALMIVVNSPGDWGSVYEPLKHAAWHGFTLTDLVFPTFLFVVGNAMSFSQGKLQHLTERVFIKKVATRTIVIFSIGFLLNAFPFVYWPEEGVIRLIDFRYVRIMGVLQRIALCYFIASIVIRYLSVRRSILFAVIVLFGYWALAYFGGYQPLQYSLEGNTSRRVDDIIFLDRNLYHGFGIPFDPEGLLSTLPAVVNVIAGYFTGLFIQRQLSPRRTFFKLIVAGCLLISAASLWNPFFPINKPIWTSSYVVYTLGWDMLITAFLIVIIEVAGLRKWTYFFEVFGKNPLFIYAISGPLLHLMGLIKVGGLSVSSLVYEQLFAGWLQAKDASLLFALSYMVLLWIIAFLMHLYRVYIKV
ncbi:acyltransferase family protein [Paradesertivirga mongoliensis]|uniref:Acyltransferase family protein n=1 Tax=Paradesertivirga mongoliensis TaxID=2100740 RepID=A0ABW4ZSM5_9SPHI|nr:DUF5009 domain-containing protein [Pedobacter mongoliensis]